jgi:hypothetical protein
MRIVLDAFGHCPAKANLDTAFDLEKRAQSALAKELSAQAVSKGLRQLAGDALKKESSRKSLRTH